MKLVLGVWCMVFGALLVGACSSTPSYPLPQADSGQLLVQLKGQPRQGVTGPKQESVQEEYGIGRESVEQGKAFERVDYDEIEDVVVIANAGQVLLPDVPASTQVATELEVTDEGFNRSQFLGLMKRGGAAFTLKNSRDSKIHIYGFNAADDYFEAEASAGSLATFNVSAPGRYDVYCEEDDAFHAVLFVAEGPDAWIGGSDSDSFFNHLAPGRYEVSVYPPRLPVWMRAVTVTAGKREVLTAELTVNDLPEVGE